MIVLHMIFFHIIYQIKSDFGPSLMISFNLNYLKTLSPNTVTLGIRVAAYEFGENTIYNSIHNKWYFISSKSWLLLSIKPIKIIISIFINTNFVISNYSLSIVCMLIKYIFLWKVGINLKVLFLKDKLHNWNSKTESWNNFYSSFIRVTV